MLFKLKREIDNRKMVEQLKKIFVITKRGNDKMALTKNWISY